jgi:hypothetical protein
MNFYKKTGVASIPALAGFPTVNGVMFLLLQLTLTSVIRQILVLNGHGHEKELKF